MRTDDKKTQGIFGWIFFFVAVVATAAVTAATYFGLEWIRGGVMGLVLAAPPENPDPGGFLTRFSQASDRFWWVGFPVIALFFLLLSLLLWLLLRPRLVRPPLPRTFIKKPGREAAPGTPAVDPKAEERLRSRYFLHLVTVLQRDGRLLDFLKEDLSSYDDAQIGAAVRNIHQDCGKALERHFTLKPVMDAEEGTDVTIGPDFDPVAVKLTGNVTGAPPFKGTLRHRGWRVDRVELPVFSGDPDPGVVAPAEVEIH